MSVCLPPLTAFQSTEAKGCPTQGRQDQGITKKEGIKITTGTKIIGKTTNLTVITGFHCSET
jgi:hypothetical protein